MSDDVGGANFFGGSNYNFTIDKFGNANSAIYLNQGYLQLPPGVYFSGDFTIIAWIKLNSHAYWQRFLDFNNDNSNSNHNADPNDNVLFGLNAESGNIFVNIGDSTSSSITVPSSLQLNQYYHVAYVLRGTTGYVYVNGSIVGSRTQNRPRNVIRINNYIGKSWWSENAYADATYDELKTHDGAMDSNQVLKDYVYSSLNGNM